MSDSIQPRTYAAMLSARVATREQARKAGYKGKSVETTRYVLPSGEIVSKRQLQQRAFVLLNASFKTLEQRSKEYKMLPTGDLPPGSYLAALRYWANQHNQSINGAMHDSRFQGAWSLKGRSRYKTAQAYELIGILSHYNGKWQYSDEFMQWWLGGGLRLAA